MCTICHLYDDAFLPLDLKHLAHLSLLFPLYPRASPADSTSDSKSPGQRSTAAFRLGNLSYRGSASASSSIPTLRRREQVQVNGTY